MTPKITLSYVLEAPIDYSAPVHEELKFTVSIEVPLEFIPHSATHTALSPSGEILFFLNGDEPHADLEKMRWVTKHPFAIVRTGVTLTATHSYYINDWDTSLSTIKDAVATSPLTGHLRNSNLVQDAYDFQGIVAGVLRALEAQPREIQHGETYYEIAKKIIKHISMVFAFGKTVKIPNNK